MICHSPLPRRQVALSSHHGRGFYSSGSVLMLLPAAGGRRMGRRRTGAGRKGGERGEQAREAAHRGPVAGLTSPGHAPMSHTQLLLASGAPASANHFPRTLAGACPSATYFRVLTHKASGHLDCGKHPQILRGGNLNWDTIHSPGIEGFQILEVLGSETQRNTGKIHCAIGAGLHGCSA